MTRARSVVLTIAGFDPSGGAGIVADIRTLLQFNCWPVAAMTSLTFQNRNAMFGATHETAKSLRAQIVPIVEDTKIAAVKVGMLPTADLIIEVRCLIDEGRLPRPVIDPVLKSSSGYELMEPGAIEIFKRELLPLALVITPNIPEAEALSGLTISDEESMRAAAGELRRLGADAVLVKGGHAGQMSGVRSQESGDRHATDILDDGGAIHVFRDEWIEGPPVRGTGCMLSSAIAAGLANGEDLPRAVAAAKQFVAGEIQSSKFKLQN